MFNKKPKTEEQFTPSDLTKLSEKGDKQAVKGEGLLKRLSSRRSSKELTRTQRWKRRGSWILSSLVILLFILWIISMLISQYGDLVVSIERGARLKGITVSENDDVEDGVTILSAERVTEVTNITYDWLPLDEFDKTEGSYNGKNYLAYTFYLQNNGHEEVDYEGQLVIKGVSKSMDEAIRVMVYKNGEAAIYGKRQYNSTEPETDATVFETDTTIMTTYTEGFAPGEVDRYTVVSWVEGNDPECVDDIMGGFIRMNMIFSIADDEE